MQIILLEKIANVGNLGDIVKVKDGFAQLPDPARQGQEGDGSERQDARRASAELEAAANASWKPRRRWAPSWKA
jgi:large subunit ribosomal protein L9